MATKKSKAIVIAMAAITGATLSEESAAAAQALRDMQKEMGIHNTNSVQVDPFDLCYTWDPTDGFVA